jgi:hypothetical protein
LEPILRPVKYIGTQLADNRVTTDTSHGIANLTRLAGLNLCAAIPQQALTAAIKNLYSPEDNE